jgi:hypothetical protein
MSIVLEIPLKYNFKWYAEEAAPKTKANSVLAVIPEWDNVIVVAHKEHGVWWMNNGLGKRKRVPTPSAWANIPPAPHEVADPKTIRIFR